MGRTGEELVRETPDRKGGLCALRHQESGSSNLEKRSREAVGMGVPGRPVEHYGFRQGLSALVCPK